MVGTSPDSLQIETLSLRARELEEDRYVSALLAPRSVRDDLIALAAFASEIGKISRIVREPYMGEIRLQWWRDALDEGQRGVAPGHPVADAFMSVVRRHDLQLSVLHGVLDAFSHELYADPPQDFQSLIAVLRAKEAALFACAAAIVKAPSFAHDTAINEAIVSYGLMRFATNLPYALARGGSPLPEEFGNLVADGRDGKAALSRLIAECRGRLSPIKASFPSLPKLWRTVLLPIALVEPYLKALERPDHDAAHDIATISPLKRVMRLGLVHWSARL